MLTSFSRLRHSFLSLALVALTASSGLADVRVPVIFSEHMVLQADIAAPVWGTADAGEKVTVSIAGQTVATTADAQGKWSVKLAKLPAGGPHTLTIAGKNTITINDVLAGEVWLGSGQSNMAMQVKTAKDWDQEQQAAKYPQIRMFTESSSAATAEQYVGHGSWKVCNPENVGAFSATAYFFGREIHKSLNVPVGLINSSVGGTPIESWISAERQKADPMLKPAIEAQERAAQQFDPEKAKAKYEQDLAKYREAVKKATAEGKPAPRRPTDPVANQERKGGPGGLFNGKIAPLIPYGIRGFLWYQGEANTSPASAKLYHTQLKLLVTDWRARWGAELPFAWVQLPNYGVKDRDWPGVREAMLKTLELPKTGMAITIDVGEEKDIHPKNKQAVGQRLALWALGTVYGKPVPTSGPIAVGHTIQNNEVVIQFKHANGGLVAKGGDLQGFVIAGSDKVWHPASARIEKDTVIVSSPDVSKPVAVRYAWENWPTCNLFNGADLPASPFRTDDWK